MPDVLAIIQGRMGSSRLPGKILLDIGGKPMLQHVIERTRRAASLDSVLFATSTDPSDDPVEQFCASIQTPCYRGSLQDVLDRYYQPALSNHARLIVRITADCPLVDPALIDATVELVAASDPSQPVDFAANRLPPPYGRSFPIGLDVEVCRFAALERAWRESTSKHYREHVMPYLYEGVTLHPLSGNISSGVSPNGFNIVQLNHVPDYGSLRWTVDTPEDLLFMREIFARLGDKADFTWQDVLAILQKEPDLARINSSIQHKTFYDVDERHTP